MASGVIRPLILPDSTEIKLLGYADDTNLRVTNERSLLEAFSLIRKFEKATASKLKGSHSTQMHFYFPFKTINFNLIPSHD